jgi:hypothetical protein
MKLKAIIFFFLFQFVAYAQVYKMKAFAFSFKYEQENGLWTNWSEWEECNVLCTIDANKERISIYSKETQIYDIIENEGSFYDEDGDWIWPLVGIDNEGGMCRVRIIKKESGDIELYVDYEDIIWAYSVYNLD